MGIFREISLRPLISGEDRICIKISEMVEREKGRSTLRTRSGAGRRDGRATGVASLHVVFIFTNEALVEVGGPEMTRSQL